MIRVRVPASTANIGPGFDILGLALNLYNTIEVEETNENILHIEYHGEGKELIPCDSKNLVYKSIKKVFDFIDKPIPNLKIKINNDIPLMGGLGSSSSAIVSGITAGNALSKADLTKSELLKLAVEEDGHPDNVTPALMGGFTFSFIENGSPNVIELKFPPDIEFIAITPKFHVSTNEARKVMPKNYSLSVVTGNTTKLFRLIRALEKNDLSNLKSILDDKIHQPYRFDLVPGFKKACDTAYESGALGAFISGSGPTLGIFAKENKDKITQSVIDVFKNEGLEAKARYLKVDFEGAKILTNSKLS